MFRDFVANLAIDNWGQISLRYGEITASLNKKFRNTESKTAYTLQVGSIGRHSAIKGISDLDMLYIMPKSKWADYNKEGGQLKLLQDTKDAIKSRYPNTKVRVDRLVVNVTYSNFHVEVQPVFEQDDGSFKYPDTSNGGCWKITKPREEIEAMSEFDEQKNKNLRRLCKMTRAWKNQHGVGMGGLLVDTLAYNFLKSTDAYNNKSYGAYDEISRDFFEYLKERPRQDYYAALGSGQRVKVKKNFKRKAKKAYELCLEAIKAGGQDVAYDKWKKVYGRPFPGRPVQEATSSGAFSFSEPAWRNTEQFIEDRFSVDIRYNIEVECDVSQNGHRTHVLSEFIRKGLRLQPDKELKFWLKDSDVPGQYSLYWKILNRGPVARERDCVRGQIVEDQGSHIKKERTLFRGEHIAECYAVRDGVVIAKSRIKVPIE